VALETGLPATASTVALLANHACTNGPWAGFGDLYRIFKTALEAPPMMEQDQPIPNTPEYADMVMRAIDDIDTQTAERRDSLLADLLCSSWGSVVAQNQ